VSRTFSVTLFLSAFLLFFVEPMVGKMVLPLLGGTPAIWNTCMVFFQTLLLVGYLYAHGLSQLKDLRAQFGVHAVLLLVAFFALPIAIPAEIATAVPESPALWLFGQLLRYVGLPFFAIATAAPLLQRWFASTRHPAAKDPYFLYAASNLGSAVALLSYPLLWEPLLRLSTQSRGWTYGFVVVVLATTACGAWTYRLPDWKTANEEKGPPPTWARRLRWVALAWIPSSLLLGVTSYLSMDVAAIPLLWTLPLFLYLGTFVIAFSPSPKLDGARASRLLAPAAVVLMIAFLLEADSPAWLILPLHLATFFLAALVCHSRLALDSPSGAYSTEFSLWLALGGWLGGVTNTFVAPSIFTGLAEYPLALVAACFFREAVLSRESARLDWRELAIPAGLASGLAVLTLWLGKLGVGSSRVAFFVLLPAAIYCFRQLARPRRFALLLGAIALSGAVFTAGRGKPIFVARNFFGVVRVTKDPRSDYHFLYHGNTLHGAQGRTPAAQGAPLLYYANRGPVAQVFEVFNSRPASRKVGLIGLGSGAMAAYARPGQEWTYFEINPVMKQIAGDAELFSYVSHTKAASLQVELGDARVQLRRAPRAIFGMLVLDAFDSDTIPTHLVTREAVQLYLERLSPGGLLLFHLSNRYLDLKPLLASLARDLDLAGLVRTETIAGEGGDDGVPSAKTTWAVLARRPQDIAPLIADERWESLPPPMPGPAWSDDYCNLVALFKW
jgi:hypothetical protein